MKQKNGKINSMTLYVFVAKTAILSIVCEQSLCFSNEFYENAMTFN